MTNAESSGFQNPVSFLIWLMADSTASTSSKRAKTTGNQTDDMDHNLDLEMLDAATMDAQQRKYKDFTAEQIAEMFGKSPGYSPQDPDDVLKLKDQASSGTTNAQTPPNPADLKDFPPLTHKSPPPHNPWSLRINGWAPTTVSVEAVRSQMQRKLKEHFQLKPIIKNRSCGTCRGEPLEANNQTLQLTVTNRQVQKAVPDKIKIGPNEAYFFLPNQQGQTQMGFRGSFFFFHTAQIIPTTTIIRQRLASLSVYPTIIRFWTANPEVTRVQVTFSNKNRLQHAIKVSLSWDHKLFSTMNETKERPAEAITE
jgi:hypothetical protein